MMKGSNRSVAKMITILRLGCDHIFWHLKDLHKHVHNILPNSSPNSLINAIYKIQLQK